MATKTADDYFATAKTWRAEINTLRDIIRDTDLEEEVKWGAPCYTYDGRNIVGLMSFKAYFGLWFHQGAELKDDRKVLINAQEGKTKALRQWRMTSAADIKPRIIKAYVKQAIELSAAGQSAPAAAKKLTIPDELAAALTNDAAAGKAFKALLPGRQRAYADYIRDAKQVATKKRRLEKILPMIKAGEDLHGQYRRS